MSEGREVVWLTEQRHYAFLVHLGAYFSVVEFTREGQDYVLEIESDEIKQWEDHAIDYEPDNDTD